MPTVKKKFDVTVGNPPYQPPVKKSAGGDGSRNIIWDKFVRLALQTTTDDGFVVLVHPALWRKPLHKLWEEMKQHHFLYLETHNDQDGQRTFGATTRYDWYVLRKNAVGLTEVRFEDGTSDIVDLHTMPFLPNYCMDALKKILVKDGEKTVDIMFSYQKHETRKPWMRQTQDKKHVYPCVHATSKTEPTKYWYSSKKSDFFVPKVIFGDARHIHNAIVDDKGEYGITQHAMAIPISSKKEGERIKKALESEQFNEFLKACRWSNFQIDWRMFKCFKHDFWKEFL